MSETTADTPAPEDSPNEPTSAPVDQQAQPTQTNEQDTKSSDQPVDDAYDPSKPVYTGGEQDKADEPEAEPGGLPEQVPPA